MNFECDNNLYRPTVRVALRMCDRRRSIIADLTALQNIDHCPVTPWHGKSIINVIVTLTDQSIIYTIVQ
jgi:hypothetical protein